jgi:hypothetical protein
MTSPIIQSAESDLALAGQILTAALGAAAPPGCDLTFRHGDVEIALPAAFACAWRNAPVDRDPGFLPCYSRVSKAVQRLLRRWLPKLYFSDPVRAGATENALPLLIYASSCLHRPACRAELTADAIDPRTAETCYRSARRRLPSVLSRVNAYLREAGEPALAAQYAPENARQILAESRRLVSKLRRLLKIEGMLIDELVAFGAAVRSASAQPGRANRRVARVVADFQRSFNGILRRLDSSGACLCLGSLLLIEATAALADLSAAITERSIACSDVYDVLAAGEQEHPAARGLQ